MLKWQELLAHSFMHPHNHQGAVHKHVYLNSKWQITVTWWSHGAKAISSTSATILRHTQTCCKFFPQTTRLCGSPDVRMSHCFLWSAFPSPPFLFHNQLQAMQENKERWNCDTQIRCTCNTQPDAPWMRRVGFSSARLVLDTFLLGPAGSFWEVKP